jgi:hypothetical protein
MAKRLYLESTIAPGLRFRVLKLNKETKQATLLGDTGVPFDRILSDELMQKYGYKAVVEVVEDEACAST